ncbi:sensor histidine kinase [Paenibacillus sp. N3/727]|uniref:sensor histidine kinase n=1 Tax=Paenibacillus TaxID=44249 RepID=UPI001AD81EDA|nr:MULTISPECIES: sensor histidine kinase [Paenibacillus]UNK21179.1 sensor histidine kinase [Paenibacillus sp. N3/727]
MTLFLLGVIVLLTILNIVQYISRRNTARNIQYITDKLEAVMASSSQEQVLLVTQDPGVHTLLNTVNRLLELKRQYEVEFTRTELAMRKMLANISHDLKTPLTVVLGYIEMIAHQPDMEPEEQKRLLTKVHSKAVEIVELINRFFDLAKLESGDRDIPLTRVEMNEICRSSILMFYDLLQSRKLEAVIDIPDTPVYAKGNEEALSRVLDNLLSNAIRYGGDGDKIGVTLRCDDDHVYVDVWDRGKGIGERDQRLIFERMYTLEDSRNQSFQGSGLGLTITKRLVEEMYGDITVRSKPFKSTVFTVKLGRLS